MEYYDPKEELTKNSSAPKYYNLKMESFELTKNRYLSQSEIPAYEPFAIPPSFELAKIHQVH